MTTHWINRIPTAVALLFALAFVVALVQRESGTLFHKEVSFSPRKDGQLIVIKDEHYSGMIPRKHRGTLAAQRGIVLEDGVPLPLPQTAMSHVAEGFGRYRLNDTYAHFAASDNSDPNTNGRIYTLRLPRRVRDRVLWGLFAGLALSLFFATRRGSMSLSIGTHNAKKWEMLLIFGISLGFAVWSHFAYAEFSDGGLCVLGMPYSDAIGWHEFAIFLKEGLGFTSGYSSSRPFYAIFQAIVFLFAGDSVAVAQWTNVFLLATAGTFIYLGAKVAFSRPVAIGTLAYFLFAAEYHRMAPTILSELPALAFGAIGFYLFVRGCAGSASQRRLFFLAGVFLALSNLTRPYTILALPLCGAVFLFLRRTHHWTWVRFAGNLALLTLGSIIVVLPWSLRQKAVNDTFSISINSSELLYGAAMPDGPGRWNDGQFAEARAAGIDTNDPRAIGKWFSMRFRETVLADPGRYLSFVWARFAEYIGRFSLDDYTVRAAIAALATIVLISACLAHGSIVPLALIPLLVPLWKWMATWTGWVSIPLAAVVVILLGRRRARICVATVLAFIVGSASLSAMTGNFAYKRGLPIVHWMFVMLVAAAVCTCLRLLVLLIAKHVLKKERQTEDADALGPWNGAPAVFVYALCGFIVLGLAGLALRTASADRSEDRLVRIGDDLREEAIALAFHGLDRPDASLVYCDVGAINDYRWELKANQETGHWSRLYERRPYDRTVTLMEVGVHSHPAAGRIALQFSGSLESVERKHAHVVVGVANIDGNAVAGHERNMIEVIALIPWDESSEALQSGEIVRFAPTPEAEAILKP